MAIRKDQAQAVVTALANRCKGHSGMTLANEKFTSGTMGQISIGQEESPQLKDFFGDLLYFGISKELLQKNRIVVKKEAGNPSDVEMEEGLYYLNFDNLRAAINQPDSPSFAKGAVA